MILRGRDVSLRVCGGTLYLADRIVLWGEHVLQAFEDREHRLSFKLPEWLHEALRINRPKLILAADWRVSAPEAVLVAPQRGAMNA